MKIGVVIPKEAKSEIMTFVKKEFPEIEAVPFAYDAIVDIPGILSGKQNNIDTFLFFGDTARRYAEKFIPHSAIWLTIPRSVSALLRLLFRAQAAGYDMHIATDLDNRPYFHLAFHEIGLSSERTSVEIIHLASYSEGLLKQDAGKMERLYRSGKVSFCITRFYKVRDILRRKKVPVYILQPSFEDIRTGLQRIILAHEMQLNQYNQLAVMYVHIDTPKDTIPDNSDYTMSMERMQVTKEIYRFARHLGAACVEQPPADYLLFTTASDMENITEHYHSLPLLRNAAESTAFTLSIGVGYGSTAAEAKYNAQRAAAQAIRSGGNRAFLRGNQLSFRIPMSPNDRKIQEKKERPIEDQILYLSKKSKISTRIIARLYEACRNEGRQRFTSAELADLIGVTPRTMNRIIARLIDHHLAQDVGRSFSSQRGRPSRIIEILF